MFSNFPWYNRPSLLPLWVTGFKNSEEEIKNIVLLSPSCNFYRPLIYFNLLGIRVDVVHFVYAAFANTFPVVTRNTSDLYLDFQRYCAM